VSCSDLRWVAVCWIVLQCHGVAVCCSECVAESCRVAVSCSELPSVFCRALQCVEVNELQCVAVWCSVIQCAAVCCSVMQCVAVWCNVLQCGAMCCSVLQCAAVCCSVLQCVAVCCSCYRITINHSYHITVSWWTASEFLFISMRNYRSRIAVSWFRLRMGVCALTAWVRRFGTNIHITWLIFWKEN